MNELVKYILPSVVVFAAAYLVLNSFLRSEDKKRKYDLMRANQKHAFPTRLRAYERLILFLERATPENLIPRLLKSEMPVQKFQSILIKAVREEYEHNLSQQIYVSNEAWHHVLAAKESMIKLINMSAAHIEQNAGAIELSKVIFEAYNKKDEAPIEVSIQFLKDEARKIL